MQHKILKKIHLYQVIKQIKMIIHSGVHTAFTLTSTDNVSHVKIKILGLFFGLQFRRVHYIAQSFVVSAQVKAEYLCSLVCELLRISVCL